VLGGNVDDADERVRFVEAVDETSEPDEPPTTPVMPSPPPFPSFETPSDAESRPDLPHQTDRRSFGGGGDDSDR
jgi:hypothetical protein